MRKTPLALQTVAKRSFATGPLVFLLLAGAVLLIGGACARGGPQSPGVVPGPDVVVKAFPSFSQDIQPIFQQFCVQCHGLQQASQGLRLDTYEGVMKGTQFGAVVSPNNPAMSPLLALLKHETDPKIWMPYHREQLSPNRIKNIENWIRYGAQNN